MEQNTDYYIIRLKQGHDEIIMTIYDFSLVGSLIKTIQTNNIESEKEEATIFITIS